MYNKILKDTAIKGFKDNNTKIHDKNESQFRFCNRIL